jgi:hypothetical protein
MENELDDLLRQKLLDQCTPEHFSGHTEFEKLSSLERLRWLSNTVYFVYTAAKNNPDLGCGDFFKGMCS